MLHRAAFRKGLSRSLYAPRFNSGNLGADAIREFRNKHFTINRLTIVGVGIKHENLISYSDAFKLPAETSKYTREHAKYLGSVLTFE